MDDISDAVLRQYTQFPYPAPNSGAWDVREVGDPSVHSALLWPEGRGRGSLKILVAGCGTVQALRYAHNNRESSVVGIDFSEASLAVQEAKRRELGLKNLTLKKLDLRLADELGEKFDLIVSSGVLHHLPNPDEGLRALTQCLMPDGVVSLMLYATGRRVGVYLLQDVFRRMGMQQTPEDVQSVRAMLDELPPHHYFKHYQNASADLKTDAGLVDTLLHPQDRSYSVPEIFAFVERAGLHFQSWGDNGNYYPEYVLRGAPNIRSRIARLPKRQQWSIVENVALHLARHTFLATKRSPEIFSIDPSDENWKHYYPMKSPGIKRTGAINDGKIPFNRSGKPFQLKEDQARVLELCSGSRRIVDLVEQNASMKNVNQFLVEMWKWGHVLVSKVARADC